MKIVCFVSGKASAGKDTFVKCMAAHLAGLPIYNVFECGKSKVQGTLDEIFEEGNFGDLPIRVVPMADEVRRELCRIRPEVSFERMKRDYSYKASFRKEQVDIGDGYRQGDPDIWVKKHKLYLQENNILDGSGFIFIPDIRYKNELYDYSKQLQIEFGSKVLVLRVRVLVDLYSQLLRMSPKSSREYCAYGRFNASECMLDDVQERDYDLIVDNRQNFEGEFGEGYYSFILSKYRDACEKIMDLWKHVKEE
jgi:hypothetical protein